MDYIKAWIYGNIMRAFLNMKCMGYILRHII